jgi:hypothetical protein
MGLRVRGLDHRGNQLPANIVNTTPSYSRSHPRAMRPSPSQTRARLSRRRADLKPCRASPFRLAYGSGACRSCSTDHGSPRSCVNQKRSGCGSAGRNWRKYSCHYSLRASFLVQCECRQARLGLACATKRPLSLSGEEGVPFWVWLRAQQLFYICAPH